MARTAKKTGEWVIKYQIEGKSVSDIISFMQFVKENYPNGKLKNEDGEIAVYIPSEQTEVKEQPKEVKEQPKEAPLTV